MVSDVDQSIADWTTCTASGVMKGWVAIPLGMVRLTKQKTSRKRVGLAKYFGYSTAGEGSSSGYQKAVGILYRVSGITVAILLQLLQ